MSMQPLPFKKLDEKAQLPVKANETDAGMDMFALDNGLATIGPNGVVITYRTGLAVQLPENHVGLIFPRSSITEKTPYSLGNAVGVIDAGYRGEILFKFRDVSNGMSRHRYKAGDRIGQLIVMPYPEFRPVEVTDLSESDRGNSGFGSSGS